jgi:quinolinate synthase
MNQEDLIRNILRLKQQKNAVILAHNYQPPTIQDIADMTGDSLELSRKAASTTADVIVFCGVAFMAETAAILNPGKTVLLPRLDAGCPMADMITPDDVRAVRAQPPSKPKARCAAPPPIPFTWWNPSRSTMPSIWPPIRI